MPLLLVVAHASLQKARVLPLLLLPLLLSTIVGAELAGPTTLLDTIRNPVVRGAAEVDGPAVEATVNIAELEDDENLRIPVEIAVVNRAHPATDVAKQVTIPVAILVLGALMLACGGTRVDEVARMVLYFGAQALMNIYMKVVLSIAVVSEEDGLQGMPAGFACTALQQMASFVLLIAWMGVSRHTACAYSPRKLTTGFEWFAMCLFSLTFTMNIALNNYSLSLIPISVNLVIRSCLPLFAFLSQLVTSCLTGDRVRTAGVPEVVAMLCGLLCSTIVVFAKEESYRIGFSRSNFIYGTIVCFLSLFSGSINLALAGVLGSSVHLNAIDTTVYMSVPATIALIPVVFLYSHPVSDATWANYMGSESATDWQIFSDVYRMSPSTIGLVLLSGALALGYNVLQYGVVQRLSAVRTAFAGNVNKAGVIALSFLLGLESLPSGLCGFMMLVGIVGNIASFTAYNYIKLNASKSEHRELQSEDMIDPSDAVAASSDDE